VCVCVSMIRESNGKLCVLVYFGILDHIENWVCACVFMLYGNLNLILNCMEICACACIFVYLFVCDCVCVCAFRCVIMCASFYV